MGIYGSIQDVLAQKLNEAFPSIPISFEQIKNTAAPASDMDGQEFEQDGDFIFVDLIPVDTNTIDPFCSDISILVDIAIHMQKASNRIYREVAEKTDSMFRPIFYVEDRAITITRANHKIVDGVLHYQFPLRFRPDATLKEDTEARFMEELATELTIKL